MTDFLGTIGAALALVWLFIAAVGILWLTYKCGDWAIDTANAGWDGLWEAVKS